MKAALFDLDNTLYDAQQYFLGAFDDISQYLATKYNMPKPKIFQTMAELWRQKTSMYPYLFNDLLDLFHLDRGNLQGIIDIFNGYTGWIEPHPDVIPTLQALRGRHHKLGIITNGNIERQKRKIESLKLELFFDVILYTKETESKSSPTPFLIALDRLKVKASDAFYIADNPLIDFKGAKEAGVRTIRILRGEFTRIPRNEYVDFEIERLDKLLEIIGQG